MTDQKEGMTKEQLGQEVRWLLQCVVSHDGQKAINLLAHYACQALELREELKNRPYSPSQSLANAELKIQVATLTTQLDNARRELVSHREKARGNYWAWQGEDDHLESLVCPVLISAQQLLALTREIEDLKHRMAKRV